jgi:hypothetical protein
VASLRRLIAKHADFKELEDAAFSVSDRAAGEIDELIPVGGLPLDDLRHCRHAVPRLFAVESG